MTVFGEFPVLAQALEYLPEIKDNEMLSEKLPG
jgi:hypothetical protein